MVSINIQNDDSSNLINEIVVFIDLLHIRILWCIPRDIQSNYIL